jgi:hypothetical protein
MKGLHRGSVLLPALLAAACSTRPTARPESPPPTPTPAAAPHNAAENPEDVRARVRFRPTPPQPESKFPPPQQSAEEEARTSNPPAEPDLLHGEPPVLLDGRPFPERAPYDPKFPDARRIRYVAADASGAGDGSLEHPWGDLQQALCGLEPGDRLVVAAGIYTGSFRIAEKCRDGTAAAPIQVFARHAFLKASGAGDVLTIRRAHWQFWEVQIALLDSDAAGFVAAGPEAHDIHVDQTHIYEGKGPAVRLAAGASSVTLSNCHIHQSSGVRIESGASGIRLLNNHNHHKRSASVTVGGGDSPESAHDISIVGNRIHNDRGPALDLSRCRGVAVSRNRLSNYRPDEDEGTGGEAVVVRSGSRDVTFSENTLLEASVAVRIGGDGDPSRPPQKILIHHNYLANRLTPTSTALWIDSGSEVRFVNNVVDRYAEPFRIASGNVSGAVIANNLVLEPASAFELAAPDSVALFDYNLFGAAGSLPGVVGRERVDSASWMQGRMPHSRVVSGLDLVGGDLGRVSGASLAEAGTPIEGLEYRGGAPDIGVADR